ncbi:MAG: hypothetical protein RR548_07460 [Carnobacterium sp.]|uniref:lipopolysaccharide biosynthesis protein n=1 Tax=Carnobacterium sp. TaxID=48221 RepID=UPI002FC61124
MRTENSIKNAVFVILGQLLGILLSFISRTFFIRLLNAEYLGVHGLFTDVLSILSLAELGFGSAVIYGLYKPLAIKDEKKIKALMNFYALIYKLVGLAVLILGLILLPFLTFVIKDTPNIPHLNLIYLLFLFDSVFTYLFAYKRSLIIADQKNYIVTYYSRSFFALVNILQILVLYLTKNFILYLLVQIVFTVIENILLSKKADSMYPFLKTKNKEKLNEADKKELYKNVKAMALHRIGGVAVEGTDNILVSAFVGIIWVGLYSNYLLVLNAINSILNPLFDSVTASVGNLNAVESKEHSFTIYKNMLFINFWLVGFCAISLWILLTPFIVLWIGPNYVMNEMLVTLTVLNFYIKGMRKTTLLFKDAFGLFWNDRYKPVVELCVNLIVSITLATYFGFVGILLGTLISTLTTVFWIEPYVLYKNGFKTTVKDYFLRFSGYSGVLLAAALPARLASLAFSDASLVHFIVRLFICLIIPNLVFILFFYKTAEFNYLFGVLMNIIKKIKVKKVNV